MGSASRLWSAWQDPDGFSSLALHRIEAGLQHLRPWHRHLGRDLEVFQEAQETYTSGQKLGIHRAVLDDLR